MNNILHLKYAVEVEKAGSISKAAENLYMSQPHLSKAIREMESDLGITVFARTARGVTPTEQGREFLGYAHRILEQIAQMESLYRPAPDTRLRFDICVPRASYISFAFTEFVKALDPEADIGFNYRETNSMRAIKNVAEEINNLAVVRYQALYEDYFLKALTERQLKYEPVWEFSYRALMSGQHPLAKEPALKFSMLQRYTEIVHGDLSVPALPVAEARSMVRAEEKRKTIAIYERGSQFELLSRLPTTYMWVSPMPKDVLDCFHLVQKNCAFAQNTYKDILITRRGYRYTSQDQLFIQKLRQAVEMVSQD